ncbi:hypothetical protein [Polynucleobacter sp. AP-Latsch-80-C2]|uniref:hypothetical protein n=1 Tax=Polynucleobacter sp. AP-Latsch-80-C2 TaxID=2576931 RepID=UPI001C0E67CA|nr:hypothetical protein [Polynucleobacter sp. AP-Latsch-80-C2]MBU3624396.1 hypothetical protein [Polynucleobacter sp. AP-Latsch-80-C2]
MKKIFSAKTISTPILVLLAFALLLLRAWPRLIHPEVWIEDGVENIYGLVNYGPIDIFRPVGGYLVLVPKLITLVSLWVSFMYYPLVSTILAWAFTIFVFIVIAKSPLYLKGQIFLAMACMLIPSDPECFGLPMYTYWWSSLLLFVMVFWRPRQYTPLRIILICLSSLSSPVCLVTLPLFLVRCFIFKQDRSEIRLFGLALGCALVQIYVMHSHGKSADFNLLFSYRAVSVFLGSYVIGNIDPGLNWLVGCLLLGFMGWGLYKNRSFPLIALYYLLLVSILMSIYRVDINILNPVNAGPRYFFFPYILLSWILIQLVFDGRYLMLRLGTTLFLLSSVANAIPHLQRSHEVLNWRSHISDCLLADKHLFPVHYVGSASGVWTFELTREQCANLVKRDFFYRVP